MIKTIYIAGPMQGIPHFNFPAFNRAADILRGQGFVVFNPAENDIAIHGDISSDNPTGSVEQAEATGFSRRLALRDDLAWIAEHATTMCMLPGWEQSSGARAEHALATAINLEFVYLG